MITSLSYEALLHEEVATYYADPLGFVLALYPWGEAGTALEQESGPDTWQRDLLIWVGQEVTARAFDGTHAVPVIRAAVSKGHGVGGSALAAWLVDWIMSTRPHCQGTITANTITQLQTKTWAAVQRWTQLCKTGHWFEINADRMYRVGYRASWFCAPQSSKEENSESFAGQHAKGSSSFYINDEDCFSSDTDVLTQRGWAAFSTLTQADSCVTMDPATGLAEYQPVIAVHWAHRRGPMIQHRSRTASWCVTPHHRMWTRRRWPKKHTHSPWGWHEAGQLAKTDEMNRYIDWGAPDVETFTIPGFTSDRKTYPARTVSMDTWVQWLGWYFSEGNLIHRQNRFGQREHVGIAISNRDLSAVRQLSTDLGLHGITYLATKTVANLRFHDRALAEYLAAFGPTCLTRSLPAFLRDLSARQIRLFLDAYVRGDGYRKTRGLEILYTSSRALADGLQELCLKSGAGSSLTVRRLKGVQRQIEGRTVTSSTDGYVITRSTYRQALTAKHPGGIRTIPYDGLIYCASLPKHHLLFTRRDGVCVWSGNSGVPEVIHTIEEGGLTDGEPMQFLFGNCTRSSGSFYQACFGKLRHRYHVVVVDSRTSRFTNKAQIAEWAADYGEDSDFFRVRVLGLPPNASDAQFIDQERVTAAQRRDVVVLPDEPLIAGCDLSWGGCFDDQTEILTDQGWKFFETLTGREQVLTLNGDVSEWGPITQIHRYAHDGELNLYEGMSANFCLTDNHRLLVRSHQKSARYVLKRYDELPGSFMMRAQNTWAGTSPAAVVFETTKPQPHGGAAVYRHEFAMTDFAAFLGWFVAEGNVHLAKPTKRTPNGKQAIELSQRSLEKRRLITALLDRMGIRYSQWSAHGTLRFAHRGLGDYLRFACGHLAANKRVPLLIKDGSPAVIRAFLDAYRAGDGSGRADGTGQCYHTSSRGLADDLHELLAKMGCAGKMSLKEEAGSETRIDGRRVVRKHTVWTVYERSGVSRKSKLSCDRVVLKSAVRRVPYRGWVWCVSTPHQTIYVRRHGVPMWSGNSDFNVIRFRRGRDARSIPSIRIPGEATRDPSVLTTRLADVLSSTYDGHRVRMLFLDSAGIAGAIGTRLRELGHRNLLEVNFGADSPSPKCRYMRDFIWQSMKEWLLTGAIDRHPGLEGDLLGPGLRPDRQQRVWLESKEDMKKRGIHSPDDADALALTFAQKVTPKRTTMHLVHRPGSTSELGWLA